MFDLDFDNLSYIYVQMYCVKAEYVVFLYV